MNSIAVWVTIWLQKIWISKLIRNKFLCFVAKKTNLLPLIIPVLFLPKCYRSCHLWFLKFKSKYPKLCKITSTTANTRRCFRRPFNGNIRILTSSSSFLRVHDMERTAYSADRNPSFFFKLPPKKHLHLQQVTNEAQHNHFQASREKRGLKKNATKKNIIRDNDKQYPPYIYILSSAHQYWK